jgi:hypothetical protein
MGIVMDNSKDVIDAVAAVATFTTTAISYFLSWNFYFPPVVPK